MLYHSNQKLAVFMFASFVSLLSSCSTTPPGTPPFLSENVSTATQAVSTKDEAREVKQAKILISQEKYREAEILLTRVISGDESNYDAWQSLLVVHCALASQSASEADEFTETDTALQSLLNAGHHLDLAKLAVFKIRSLATEPGANYAPESVTSAENNYEAMKAEVQSVIDDFCKSQLEDADTWAWNAINHPIHWIGPNNRHEIVGCLKCLKPVMKLKAWTTEKNCTELTRLYVKCKGAVDVNKEWQSLCAQAGIVLNGEAE